MHMVSNSGCDHHVSAVRPPHDCVYWSLAACMEQAYTATYNAPQRAKRCGAVSIWLACKNRVWGLLRADRRQRTALPGYRHTMPGRMNGPRPRPRAYNARNGRGLCLTAGTQTLRDGLVTGRQRANRQATGAGKVSRRAQKSPWQAVGACQGGALCGQIVNSRPYLSRCAAIYWLLYGPLPKAQAFFVCPPVLACPVVGQAV